MKSNEKFKKELRDTKAKTLKFEKSLTIWNAVKIKDLITAALNNCTSLVLDFKNSEEYDYSFLQIFYSLLKTSHVQGIEITIRNICPELKNLIKESGFINLDYSVFRQ